MTQVFIVTSWQPRYLITTTGQSPSPLGRTQRTGRASHRPWGNGSTRQDRKREKEEKTNSSPPPPPPPAAMTIHWGASFRPPFSPQPPTHVRRCCHRPLGFLRERENNCLSLSLSSVSLCKHPSSLRSSATRNLAHAARRVLYTPNSSSSGGDMSLSRS